MKKLSSIIFGIFLTFSLFAEARHALLIANGDYAKFGKLTAPVKEARDLRKTLEKLGFSVMLVENGSREKMLDSLYDFEEILEKNGGIAFFLYSGHGVQVNGKNYLIPVDADIPDERRVSTRAVDVDEVMESMQGDTNIVILDACRDNPLPKSSTKAATKGLALVTEKPKNSIIVYSAEPNKTALDGYFTPILTEKLLEQKSFTDILMEVRREVQIRTNMAQSPEETGRLIENIYLAGRIEPSSTSITTSTDSKIQNSTSDIAGTYVLKSLSDVGITMTAFDFFKEYSTYVSDTSEFFGLVINKDGTGIMSYMGETKKIVWNDKSQKMTIDGESISYTFKNNVLTIFPTNRTMFEFVKKQNIIDFANMLWDSQLDILENRINDIINRYTIIVDGVPSKIGINIITLPNKNIISVNNYEIYELSESIYELFELGLGNEKTGILLLMDMENCKYDIIPHGSAAHYTFTDYGKSKLEESFIEDFGNNKWYDSFSKYLDEVERQLMWAEKGKPVDISNNKKINDGFVFVEGGTFIMGNNAGSSDEKPEHKVTVSSFYICDHEVTQAEYKAVMGTNPSYYEGDNRPVNFMSWYDVLYYCNMKSIKEGLELCYKVNGNQNIYNWGYTPHNKDEIKGTITCDFNANGYRLPTEAEWEYAARGGKKSKNYTYSGSDNIDLVAWFDGNSKSTIHNVKTKQSNELGLYDMSGNVSEWCWDFSGKYSITAQKNPTGVSDGYNRSVRGGDYWDEPSYCTVSFRFEDSSPGYDGGRPWDAMPWGFRLVRSAQ